MILNSKLILIGAGLLALSACGETSSKNWNSEAGAFLDEGGFGNPTMNNILAQMCKGRAKGYIVADPVVKVDGATASGAPLYREGKVMCSGELNGKYAQVIWSNYVRSAKPATDVGGGINALESSAGG